MVQCSLCNMGFDENDPLFLERIRVHTEYHDGSIKGKLRHNENARIKRNTTMGVPNYE